MKRSLMLLLCLALALALTGCAQPKQAEFEVIPQNIGGTPTPEPQPQAAGPLGDGAIDPLAEEDEGEDVYYTDSVDPYEYGADNAFAVDSTPFPYAGSTPMPLEPVDLPTPTPRPELQFTYQEYAATKLGLSFEGPAGWLVDDTLSDSYILTEPAELQKDGFTASITVRAVGVAKQYSKAEMRSEVKQILSTLGGTNYSTWSPSNTADRKLLDKDGIYANFSGTLVTGVRVRGRVHVGCVNNTLYILIYEQPAGYNSDYLKNDAKLRATLKLTK